MNDRPCILVLPKTRDRIDRARKGNALLLSKGAAAPRRFSALLRAGWGALPPTLKIGGFSTPPPEYFEKDEGVTAFCLLRPWRGSTGRPFRPSRCLAGFC